MATRAVTPTPINPGPKYRAIKTGIAEPILKTFHALEYGWLKVTQFFSRVWIDLCSGILMAWNRVSKGIKAAQSWIAEKVVGVMAFFDESIDEDAVKQAVRDSYQQEMDALDGEMNKLENEHTAKLNTEVKLCCDNCRDKLPALKNQCAENCGNK